MSRADDAGILEGLLRSQAWILLLQEAREEQQTTEDELMAMGTDAKRRDELAGYRAGMRFVLGLPAQLIEEYRSNDERGDDL